MSFLRLRRLLAHLRLGHGRPALVAGGHRGARAVAAASPRLLLGASAVGAAAAACTSVRGFAACEAVHGKEESPMLRGKADIYGGMIIDPAGLPTDPSEFEAQLDTSLALWRANGTRGVWLQVPIQKAKLIAVAVDRGFVFHHAERSHCMLTNWLPKDVPSPLPPNPSHQVGVGALVVNEDNKVLFVQEAYGPTAGKGVWKIPTGLVEAREDIKDAVERELREETGLSAEFEKVISIRHGHAAPFGKSDLFFVCLMRYRGGGEGQLSLQQAEIAKAKWGDFSEFLEQTPYPKEMPVWFKAYSQCMGKDGVVGNVEGISHERLMKTPKSKDGPLEYVYF